MAVHSNLTVRLGASVVRVSPCEAAVTAWLATIRAAIRLGQAETAAHLTVGFVRRLRELGVWE